jgi:3-hydroxyacyl-[acyl-carrier-protein] dehydratase
LQGLLLNNLYTIQNITETEKIIQATVLLQAGHPIFKGHFPGHPVLPGVCMLEMITEITGSHLQERIRITSASMIKYLNMIDPNKDPLIQFEIKYQRGTTNIATEAKIYSGNRVFMKCQLSFLFLQKD